MKINHIKIQPGFYLFAAVALIMVPIKWFTAWLIAAIVHELFHIFALVLLGCKIYEIEFDFSGAVIKTSDGNGKSIFISTLAGPLGGICLFALLRVFPRIALCGLVQSIYNLLPIYPLDGGRAMHIFLKQFLPDKIVGKVMKTTEYFVILIVFLMCLYRAGTMESTVYVLLVIIAIMIKKKFLANRDREEYNRIDCLQTR